MGEILLSAAAALLEIFGEVLVQLIFELGATALRSQFKLRVISSTIGLLAGGAIAGLVSGWVVPHHLFAQHLQFRGVSMVAAPLATGAAMHFAGMRLRDWGHEPSSLATFRGGALFAFAMAIVRLAMVRA